MNQLQRLQMMDDEEFRNIVSECETKAELHKRLRVTCNGRGAKALGKKIEDTGAILKDIQLKWEWIEKECSICKKIFRTQKDHPREKKYCSHQCANEDIGIKRIKECGECLCCGKKLTNVRSYFCSNKCSSEQIYLEYINRWKFGLENGIKGKYGLSLHIRRYLFEKYNSKCQKCGWGNTHPVTGNVPLAVHHKDGDSANNKEENLELLCPNCHCMTENYGSLNKSNSIKRKK